MIDMTVKEYIDLHDQYSGFEGLFSFARETLNKKTLSMDEVKAIHNTYSSVDTYFRNKTNFVSLINNWLVGE